MSGIFSGCINFNHNIDCWNVSNVMNMSYAFYGCKHFNQPLKSWDTKNLIKVSHMFCGCERFNQPLNFDTSKINSFFAMFKDCKNFNQQLDFDLSSARDLSYMFYGCACLTKMIKIPISVESNIENMDCSFEDCTKFDVDLNYLNSVLVNLKSAESCFDGTKLESNLPKWAKAFIKNKKSNRAIKIDSVSKNKTIKIKAKNAIKDKKLIRIVNGFYKFSGKNNGFKETGYEKNAQFLNQGLEAYLRDFEICFNVDEIKAEMRECSVEFIAYNCDFGFECENILPIDENAEFRCDFVNTYHQDSRSFSISIIKLNALNLPLENGDKIIILGDKSKDEILDFIKNEEKILEIKVEIKDSDVCNKYAGRRWE